MIPARLASARLTRKPLVPIAGRPLIEWVWRRMSELEFLDDLVVATDAEEIVEAVERFGGRAVMTGSEHASGTDRVAEVAGREEYEAYERIVNLQGDEPLLPDAAAAGAVEQLVAGWDVGTAAVPIASVEQWRAPSTVKVVRGDDGGALYFSRAAIPHDGEGSGTRRDAPPLRHLGVYAFTRSALLEATSLPEHPLERREGLEQLRWLAAGLRIGVAVVEGGGFGIDTEDDVARAEAILGGREGSLT